MSFYTYIDRSGDRLFHRYIDDAGKRHQEVIKDFPFELYLKSQSGSFKSLYDDDLTVVKKVGIAALRNFVKEQEGVQEVFGQTDPVSQFVAKTYPGKIEFDFDLLKIFSFDIETRFDGYEPEQECRVRKTFSNIEEIQTVEWVRKKAKAGGYEVWDLYNEAWYPIGSCPQLMVGGFPDPTKAEYEVTAISIKRMGKKRTLVLGLKDFKSTELIDYHQVADEKHLLKEFIAIISSVEPDILTGWNVEGFDIPYLINRIKKVLGDSAINRLSPFHSDTVNCVEESFSRDNSDTVYKILGIVIYDYMVLYKSFNNENRERYGLDFISQIEEVGGKVNYEEFDNLMHLYLANFKKFIEYSAEDANLIELLDEKKQFIRLAVTTALMTKSRFNDVFGKVKMWDNLIYDLALQENKIIPPQKRPSGGAIIGAYVKEPIPGMYRWIASLDLASLYPSICIMFNMSPETMIQGATGQLNYVEMLLKGQDLAKKAKESGYCMTANGAVFRQDRIGVLPKAMRYVFDTRKAYKKKMIEIEKLREAEKSKPNPSELKLHELSNQISMFNAAQGSMKILANSGYGATANAGFRYFNHDIAEGITLTGQLSIQYIGNFINAFLNERFGVNRDWVITSDTDSVYLSLDRVPSDPLNKAKSLQEVDDFIHEELQPAINTAFEELARSLGADENLLDMKREAISDVGFFRGKKNYAIEVLDNEGVRYASPKLKIMGLEPVRSDRPMIVRKKLKECIATILRGSVEDLRKVVKDFESEFNSANVFDISTPKGCNGMNDYSPDGVTPKSGKGVTVPGHVRAALVHNRMVRDLGLTKKVKKIRDGDKIRILRLKIPNPALHHTVGFIDALPPEFGLEDYIDKDDMFKSSFMIPLDSYCDAVGWNLKKVSSLEDLFS